MKRTFLAASALCLVGLGALLAAAQGGAAGLTRIGAAAAVSGQIKATAPGAVGRVISSGKPLFLNDRVVSDSAGRMQVMLLDETVFTLGPNSDMVLDEFVYDPGTSAGKVTARILKGAFRFVTGRIARRNPFTMKVKLAVGTIGVRGTVVVGQTGPDGSIVANAGAGAGNNANEPPSGIYVENEGTTVDVDQTGQGTTIKPGQPPAPPSDMSGQIGQISQDLESPSNGKGKGGKPPEGGDSATSESGQDTAAGGLGAADTQELQDDVESLTEDQTKAAQDAALQDKTVTDSIWEDIRSKLPSGTGTYAGSGTFHQSGCFSGPCSFDGTWGYSLSVNYGTRNISGSATINTASFGGDINHPGDTISKSYVTDTGVAVFSATTTGATYNFKFQSVGDQPASQIVGSATFSSGSQVGASVGTVVAPKQ